MLQIRTATLMLGGLLAVGCQGTAQTASSAPPARDVLDVHPTPSAAPVSSVAMVNTPMTAEATAAPVMASDGPSIAATPTMASAHIVKRGETLYSIARTSYGDGKQWTRIAAANPGVNTSGLKVGQTLAMP